MRCLYALFYKGWATTKVYTLSLHDALPIFHPRQQRPAPLLLGVRRLPVPGAQQAHHVAVDRKSTRLNFSHSQISYAVFCLKKKNSRVFDLNPHFPNRRVEPTDANLELTASA